MKTASMTAALALGAATAACDGVDLERMINQPSYRAYEANPIFDDGMAMRRPPPGTVSRQARLGPPALVEGMVNGSFVETVPLELERRDLEHGRRRFDIFCAACHGVRGDGQSQVAENMDIRPPPSLVDPPVSDYPPGRIYRAIDVGYGLMPAYADRLTEKERWAVVAYVEVLQLRLEVPFDELPPELQKEAEPWLP